MPSHITRRVDRLEEAEPRFLGLGDLLDELDADPKTINKNRLGRVPHPELIRALGRLPSA